MAAVTLLGSATFNTNSGTHTVTATPAANDLIILVVANTGNTNSVAPTDNNSDGLGTYTKITTALKATSADAMDIWVRNALIGSATSTVFTQAAGTTTGGGLAVLKATSMTFTGSAAVRQFAIQSNQASGGTPTPVFGKAVLTANAVIGAVFNATSPATMTPRGTPAYTERADVGYSTPTTGLEIMSIDSGETGTSIAWGGTSASAFCSAVIELNINTASPTVALNTPADTATGISTTPTLNFTGTDADSDTLEYLVEVDTDSNFNSPNIVSDNFDDNSLAAIWTDWGGGNTNETNSRLEITTQATTANGYYGINLTATHNLTGTKAIVRLVSAGDTKLASLDAIFQIEKADLTGDDTATIYQEAGSLIFKRRAATVETVTSVPYDPALHKWLKIEESGGNIITSTSPDRVTWTAQRTFSNPFTDITNVILTLSAGTWASEASGSLVIFDDLTWGGDPLLSKSSLTDAGFTAGHPFSSGSAKDFTIQAGDALTGGTTYYWRVAAVDPSGRNIYGSFSTPRSFTTSSGGGSTPPPNWPIFDGNKFWGPRFS